MEYSGWANDGGNIDNSRHFEQNRHQDILPQDQLDHNQRPHSHFAPFYIKEEIRDNYTVPDPYPPQQHHQQHHLPHNNSALEQEYRLEQYARGERPGMVLSNPIPDYSVASGSSPFTTQQSAPHFQPRPRPIMSSDPRRAFDYQQQRQEERAMAYQQPEWEYSTQQQNGMRSNGEPRLQDLLPQPTECGQLATNHLNYTTAHQPLDGYQHLRDNGLQQLHEQIPQQYLQQVEQDPQYLSADESNADPGKKVRKRRRLKGELPRDHALRKYKCTECEQKFARPSALATHVLTHTKEKPFVCATCERGFAVMSNLRRHCRVRKHETSPASTSPPARATGTPILNNGNPWQ